MERFFLLLSRGQYILENHIRNSNKGYLFRMQQTRSQWGSIFQFLCLHSMKALRFLVWCLCAWCPFRQDNSTHLASHTIAAPLGRMACLIFHRNKGIVRGWAWLCPLLNSSGSLTRRFRTVLEYSSGLIFTSSTLPTQIISEV